MLENFNMDKDGIITDPGKFEGESIIIPYFYNEILEGSADDDFEEEHGIIIEKEDREAYPQHIFSQDYGVVLKITDDGFVKGKILSKAEYALWKKVQEKRTGREE